MSEIRQPLGSLKLTEINTARRELLDLSKKNKTTEKENLIQDNKNAEASKKVSINQLLQQNADLKKKYGLLEKENALLKQSIIQQNEKLKNLDTSVYEFSNLYHLSKVEIDDLRVVIERQEKQILKLEKEKKRLEKKLSSKSNQEIVQRRREDAKADYIIRQMLLKNKQEEVDALQFANELLLQQMRQLQETFERNLEEEKSKFENNLSQIKKQGEMEKLKQQTEISNLICKYGDILKQVVEAFTSFDKKTIKLQNRLSEACEKLKLLKIKPTVAEQSVQTV